MNTDSEKNTQTAPLVSQNDGNSHSDDNERPEPFATLMEVVAEYGYEQVLQCLSNNAELDAEDAAEDGDVCDDCLETYARVHSGLEALLGSVWPTTGETL